MQALLEDVRSLPGVVGSMFCDRRRGLLARAFPREYDDASLQAVAAALGASVPRLAGLTGPVGVVDLRYRDARVVIRPEGDAALLVLCDRTANAQQVLGFASAVCTMLVREAATRQDPFSPPVIARAPPGGTAAAPDAPLRSSAAAPGPAPSPTPVPAPMPSTAARAPDAAAPGRQRTPAAEPPPATPSEPLDAVEVPFEVTLVPTALPRTSAGEPRWAQGPEPALAPPEAARGAAPSFDRRRRRPASALVAFLVIAGAAYGAARLMGFGQYPLRAPAASTVPPLPAPQQGPTPSPVQWRLHLSGAGAFAADLVPALASAYLAGQGTTAVQVSRPEPEVAQVRGLADGGAVGIEIRAGDTARGLEDLLAGNADVALATRRPTPEELKRLGPLGPVAQGERVLGADGIAVIVNRVNPIASLTREQLGGLLSGATTTWGRLRVAGEVASGGIHVYLPDDGSGVPDVARAAVPGGKPLAIGARRLPTPRAVAEAVAADPTAVGLVPMADVGGARAVPLGDGVGPAVLPTAPTVAADRYPLTRRLYLYTARAPRSPWAARFADFALSAEGQVLVRKAGFVGPAAKAPAPAAPRIAAAPAPAAAPAAAAPPAAAPASTPAATPAATPAVVARPAVKPPVPERAEAEGLSPALVAALASIPAVRQPAPAAAPAAAEAGSAAPASGAAEPTAAAPATPAAAAADPSPAPPQRAAQPAGSEGLVVWNRAAGKPRVAELGCLERSTHVPEDALPYVAGRVVTVKFTVSKEGVPSQYQMTTPGTPDAASDALWAAIQSCQWLPGADEAGHPASMPVVMPFQFARE
jgi:phosphate transport system substrate-binding protein